MSLSEVPGTAAGTARGKSGYGGAGVQLAAQLQLNRTIILCVDTNRLERNKMSPETEARLFAKLDSLGDMISRIQEDVRDIRIAVRALDDRVRQVEISNGTILGRLEEQSRLLHRLVPNY